MKTMVGEFVEDRGTIDNLRLPTKRTLYIHTTCFERKWRAVLYLSTQKGT